MTRASIYRYLTGAEVLAAVLLAGCSKGAAPDLPTVPVTGTVTYKGAPLAGAQVGFINNDKEKGKPANATTDEQGKFQLKTFFGGATQADGALPGEYKVTVLKLETSAAPADLEGPPVTQTDPSKVSDVKSLTPPKYGNVAETDLTATVQAAGENNFTFDLND